MIKKSFLEILHFLYLLPNEDEAGTGSGSACRRIRNVFFLPLYNKTFHGDYENIVLKWPGQFGVVLWPSGAFEGIIRCKKKEMLDRNTEQILSKNDPLSKDTDTPDFEDTLTEEKWVEYYDENLA